MSGLSAFRTPVAATPLDLGIKYATPVLVEDAPVVVVPIHLEAPAGGQASAISSSALSITANSMLGAAGYKLFKSATMGGVYVQVGDSLQTPSYNDNGLSPSTTYYYRWQSLGNGTTSAHSSLGVEFSGTTQSANSGTSGGDYITQDYITSDYIE